VDRPPGPVETHGDVFDGSRYQSKSPVQNLNGNWTHGQVACWTRFDACFSITIRMEAYYGSNATGQSSATRDYHCAVPWTLGVHVRQPKTRDRGISTATSNAESLIRHPVIFPRRPCAWRIFSCSLRCRSYEPPGRHPVLGRPSHTNGSPGVLTPKAAQATNGGHGINTTLAVPGKVALIVAVADVHIG